MKQIVFVMVWILSSNLVVVAQDESQIDSNAVVTNSLWDNWYGQLGVDMTLMNPYGTNFADVFWCVGGGSLRC